MPIDLTAAAQLYRDFVTTDADSRTHTVSSAWIYRCIAGRHTWLLSLIMGVAGYAVRWDAASSSVLSAELLQAAGVVDPAHAAYRSLAPWTGKTSTGKHPRDPVANPSLGLSIAHYQGAALADFYRATPLRAQAPVYTDAPWPQAYAGTKSRPIHCDGAPVRGWGLQYQHGGQSRVLELPQICTDASAAHCLTDGACTYLAGTISGRLLRWVGYNERDAQRPWMERQWQREALAAWCTHHYSTAAGLVYPALRWYASYWLPALVLSCEHAQNDVTHTMLLAAIANSRGFGGARPYAPHPASAIVERYVPRLGHTERAGHDERRILNTLRAAALVRYLVAAP